MYNKNDNNLYNTDTFNNFYYEDGSRLCIYNGSKFWYNKDSYYHRIGGPAVEWASGAKEYLVNGVLHREDGPAYIGITGDEEYYINGERYDTLEEGLMDQAIG